MTLSILLVLYAIVAAGCFIYALLNLFHVLRYGRLDAPTYFMTGAFIAGFLFIVFVSYTYIRTVDWDAPIFSISNNPLNNTNIKTGF